MATYDRALFSVEDLEEELPFVELWGHRVNMRDPRDFSLDDNNRVVRFNRSLGDLDKLGQLRDPKVAQLEETADEFIEFVCIDLPEEVRGDSRWKFMVKLRVIRAYNEIFTKAMTFEEDLSEASLEDQDDL